MIVTNITRCEENEFLVNLGLATRKMSEIEFRTSLTDDSVEKMMDVLEKLKEKSTIPILSLTDDEKPEKESIFLWSTGGMGRFETLTLRPNMPEDVVDDAFQKIAELVKKIEVDDIVCCLISDLFLKPEDFDDIAEAIVENAKGKRCFYPGHYGHVYKIAEHPELRIQSVQLRGNQEPKYCFIGENWEQDNAMPIDVLSIINYLQVVSEGCESSITHD